MPIQRIVKIKSGVKAGFDPQPDPPRIAAIGSAVKVSVVGR